MTEDKMPGPVGQEDDGWLSRLDRCLSNDALRQKFRLWVDPAPGSVWARISSNTLVHLFLGFLLTGIVGGALTNHYAAKQKEIDRARSFADRLNETRIAKIAQVWEKLSLHEAAATRFSEDAAEIERIQSRPKMPPQDDPEVQRLADATKRDMKAMVELAGDIRNLSDQNRIWLGEKSYQRIREYLDETHALIREALVAGQTTPASRKRTTLAEIRQLVFSNEE
jgi:hypothetical protein